MLSPAIYAVFYFLSFFINVLSLSENFVSEIFAYCLRGKQVNRFVKERLKVILYVGECEKTYNCGRDKVYQYIHIAVFAGGAVNVGAKKRYRFNIRQMGVILDCF